MLIYVNNTGNIKFHINSISIQFTLTIFLDFFQNKIIDDKSKDHTPKKRFFIE